MKTVSWKKIKENLIFLPGIVLLAVWPCAVHMDTVKTGLEDYPWYPSLVTQEDFFMHVRSLFLLFLALWMLICIAVQIRRYREEKKRTGQFWPLLVYEGFAVLSALFSVNREFSFHGIVEQYEHIGVLLAYGIVAVYFYFTCGDRGKGIFRGALLAGAAIQCVIGFTQLTGNDFWNSSLGRWLILLGRRGGTDYYSVFGEESSGQVYLSFYHPNYAAVYLLLVLPSAVAAAWCARKVWQKAAALLLTAFLLICLWGTGSKTAALVLPAVILLGGLLALPGKRGRIRFNALWLLGIMTAAAMAFLLPGTTFLKEIGSSIIPERQIYALKEVSLAEEGIYVTWNENRLLLSMEEEGEKTYFSVLGADGNGLPMNYDPETGHFTLLSEGGELEFEAYTEDENFWIIMYQGEIPWYFTKSSKDTSWKYINLYQKPDTPENAPAAFGKGYESALSGRVYLWSRSLPLLGQHLLLGSGPDTFPLIFPQNDYVTRANVGLDMLMPVISKVHSLYLQIALQTGMISLAALLVFWIRYFLHGRKIMKRKGQSREEIIWEAAGLVSVAGFLLMGITNDSVVAVSPVFWALLGMGYSRK